MQPQTSGKWRLTIRFSDDRREIAAYDSEEQALAYGLAVTDEHQGAIFSIDFIDSSVDQRPSSAPI